MTDAVQKLYEISEALAAQRLGVERVEDTFNVSQGTGISAHKAHIDPLPFVESLSAAADSRRRQIHGFASGIKHVLLEPKRSRANQWSFVDSAGRLVPTVQSRDFVSGVGQAAESPAWALPFVDDLFFVYLLELDMGLRVVTEDQVEFWGVSQDRITSAARSLLYHKSRNLKFKPFDDDPLVHRMKAGDGLDAARCLVVGDLFYTEIGDGFRFSLPSPDHFLCTFDAAPESIQALQKKTNAVCEDQDYYLTNQIFRFDVGKPVPVEATRG